MPCWTFLHHKVLLQSSYTRYENEALWFSSAQPPMCSITTKSLNLINKPTSTFFNSQYRLPRRRVKPISKPLYPFPNSPCGCAIRRINGPDHYSVLKGMISAVKTSAFRSSNGDDDGIRSFEQDVLINRSSSSSSSSGFESTLNRLSKWMIAFLFAGIVVWRHDSEAMWATTGAVMNSTISMSLKKLLNQERPFSDSTISRSDPGMPSSHAQSIFYVLVFAIISVVEWLGMNQVTLTISGIILAFASYLSWLRISQQYHTVSQVVVGAMLGSVFCIFWLWSWNALVLELFISFFWVRFCVLLGAAGFCLSFALYVISHWFHDEL